MNLHYCKYVAQNNNVFGIVLCVLIPSIRDDGESYNRILDFSFFIRLHAAQNRTKVTNTSII